MFLFKRTSPILWLGFALAILGSFVLARMALADDTPPPNAAQLALALDVARTAVNEASLSAGPRDVDLVYEATRWHGEDDSARVDWLRAHSRCANPAGDCNRDGAVNARDDVAASRRPGNARWTRNLSWSNAKPSGFDSAWRWHPALWERALRHALARVMADQPTNVCGVPIRTWGRPSDFAARPALIPVECGTANVGATSTRYVRRARRAETRRGYVRRLARAPAAM